MNPVSVRDFRRKMAEIGYEHTPDSAAAIHKAITDLMDAITIDDYIAWESMSDDEIAAMPPDERALFSVKMHAARRKYVERPRK